MPLRIGVISDTHGLLRPEAIAFLRGSDFIIHGGDIGGADILEELESIAPVTAVRGNNDTAPWARDLKEAATVQAQGVCVYVIHNLAEIEFDPRDRDLRVVVSGHSHKPRIEERNGVMFLNPGSAGPRRFKLPIALGELMVESSAVTARIVHI